MVRKSINTVAGPATTKTPYPETPVSSNGWNPGAHSLVASEGHDVESTNPLTYPNDPNDGFVATNAWASVSPGDKVDLMPASREVPRGGPGQAVEIDTSPREDSLPPSLRIGIADLTPRSSIESQRSAKSTGKLGPTIELRHLANEPCNQNTNSNNPYFRLKPEDNELRSDLDLHGDNTMNIWARGSEACAQDTQVPAQAPLNTTSSQPFAEPWFDFASSPTEGGSSSSSRLAPHPSIPNAYEELSRNPFDGLDAFEEHGPAANEGDKLACSQLATDTPKMDSHGQQETPEITDVSELPRPAEAKTPSDPVPLQFGDAPPELPPKRSLEETDVPSLQQPRLEPDYPVKPKDQPDADPNSQKEGQRNETYQIRLVNWLDSVRPNHLRRSPIMVQNANGPCPLLALVNALTLSTPGDIETPLVETLKTREQISLGLLLDAVFDELMSGRRGDAAQSLPDVTDLYSFLITLHTGMNVNPSFVPLETKVTSLLDAPILESPNELTTLGQPGVFEDTREMRLYSTFAIPLIHGWIPPRDHVAFGALKRSARTYEEAQTLLFREEEIEEKLKYQGLTSDEQIMLEDVASVKYFLATSATQLTNYGLQCISESLRPGSIAILFRNDHFSTLYKHPQSGQLFTLVTDMGYAGHDEVVWESLVDVSGEGSEYFAGDFRPVGNVAGDTHSPSNHADGGNNSGWSTVSRLNSSSRAGQSSARGIRNIQNVPESGPPSTGFSLLTLDEPVSSPLSTKAEQEDHDLALAMQLHEEDIAARQLQEERRDSATLARNRRDQAHVGAQSHSNRGASGRDRGRGFGHSLSPGTGSAQVVRPLVPPRVQGQSRRKAEDSGDEAPPPTYEQAAKGPAYHPPANQPMQMQTPPLPTRQDSGRPYQMSAYNQNAARASPELPASRASNHVSPNSGMSPAMGQGDTNRRSKYDTRGKWSSSGGGNGGGGFRRGDGTSRGNSGEGDEKNCTLM